MLIKLDQFAPDADFTVPGVIVSAQHLIPTIRGYKAAPTAASAGMAALASTCFGAAVMRDLDNTTRYFAGLATAIYEYTGGAWVDVTRAVGGAYGASTDARWSFSQFGNVALATNKADTLQYSDTGAFANITGAPKAKLVETVNQFVIVADTNDAGFGDSPDRWWCCAIGDYTDWTVNTATQCVSSRLTSSPGRITALRRLGDGIVAYKDRAMFAGSYVGAPEAWSFQEVPGQVGCVAQGGVVDIGAAHVFVGSDGNFWMFDGSRPTPIGNPIKEWFYADLYLEYSYRIQSVHDRANSLVYFYYPSRTGAGALDSCIVYNYRANKWGVDDRTIEAAVDYVAAGVTFDGAFATATTFATVDAGLTFDSGFLTAGQPVPAFIDTAHTTYTLTGASDAWEFTTNDFGDDSEYTTITRVKGRFLTKPTTASLINYYRNEMGDALTTDSTTTWGSGKFDFIRSARWHRFAVSGTGGGELTGLDVQAEADGSE